MKRTTFLLITCIILLGSCSKTSQLSSDKEIISLEMQKWNGLNFAAGEQTVSIQGTDILVKLPFTADKTKLIAQVVHTGTSIAPDPAVIRDYTNPVIYTVTAQDGSTKQYTVKVSLSSPEMVYFGSGNHKFYALNINTGALLWHHTANSALVYSSPTYSDGVVYLGGINSRVYAFHAGTGVIKWSYQVGNSGIESDAVVVNGTIYVGCNDDFLVAINAETGVEKWRYMTGGNISASPTIGNGSVYFGSSDGKIYAVDTANGTLKWSFTTNGMINQSGPALVNNTIYAGSRDGHIYAIDAITGLQKWKFSSNGISFEQSSPTVSNGIVYIGAWYDVSNFSRKGSFYAINANTGQLVWETLQNTGISSSPTVAGGIVYITADDNLIHALDAATGAPKWTRQVLANSGSPAVSGGVVFVGGGGTGYFYALDAVTGAEKWKFATPQGYMTSSPLILNTAGTPDHSGDSGSMN